MYNLYYSRSEACRVNLAEIFTIRFDLTHLVVKTSEWKRFDPRLSDAKSSLTISSWLVKWMSHPSHSVVLERLVLRIDCANRMTGIIGPRSWIPLKMIEKISECQGKSHFLTIPAVMSSMGSLGSSGVSGPSSISISVAALGPVSISTSGAEESMRSWSIYINQFCSSCIMNPCWVRF